MASWKYVDVDSLADTGVAPGFALGPCDCVTIQATNMLPGEAVQIQKVVGFDPKTCVINTAPFTKTTCDTCEFVEFTQENCEERFCEEGQYMVFNCGLDENGDPVVGSPSIRYSISKGTKSCC